MSAAPNYANLAKIALREHLSGLLADAKGYVATPQMNLIPGVTMEQFEEDLRQGDGNELRMKFCALHSSSALAVNAFGPFKEHPEDLVLLEKRGFTGLAFEKKLETGLKRKPNLDVGLERAGETVGIESKFLEHLRRKKGSFKDKYTPDALPWVEECWWEAWHKAQSAGKTYLDVAQLAKHYFGLSRALRGRPDRSATLLYLFWEPANASAIQACVEHRGEIEALKARVAKSEVLFCSMSYPQLWAMWEGEHLPAWVRSHARDLKQRYTLTL